MKMATKFPIRRFVDDLLLSDRRLAERPDLELELDWAGEFDELPPMYRNSDGAGSYGIRLEKQGLGYVEIAANRQLRQDEYERVELVAAVLVYCLCKDRLLLAHHIGEILKEVRCSLKLSQEAVATHTGTGRFTVWKWETGAQAPSISAMYKWCHALGLISPARTALVRVVDFSPELLRFLQEDPTRLRSLTPDQFERFVAERMDRMGYNVTLTGATNQKDGGIDLIAVPKEASVGSVVIAGQMKHHRGEQTTGRDAVDRLLAWKDSYFGVGLLVTNTSFTKDAVWTAQQERNARFLRLRDFTDLKLWLEGCFGSEGDWREIPDRIELAPGLVIEIPKPRITSAFDGSVFGHAVGRTGSAGKRKR
jgi:transcriptional regulator with XRE-family HTH domain